MRYKVCNACYKLCNKLFLADGKKYQAERKNYLLATKKYQQKIAPPNRIKTCFGLAIKNLGAVSHIGHSPEVAFYRISQNA